MASVLGWNPGTGRQNSSWASTGWVTAHCAVAVMPADRANTGDPTAYLADEGVEVERLTRQGVVQWVLVKADWSGAVLLLEVPDLENARATVEALPITAHGLTRFDLTSVVDAPGKN